MIMEGLSAICAGLGVLLEDGSYEMGGYCLDSLKDLLRFMRRDDPQTREVFKQVCKWNIVSKNLIPIIEQFQDDRNLVLNAVKVLVFLSMPIEESSTDIPQQMENLWNLKSSIIRSDTVAVAVSLLELPLENLEHESLLEDDWKLIQLVLTLFRNVLAVQDISFMRKGGISEFVSIRDRYLELLFHENVMDLIIVITQHISGPRGYFRQDNLLLLEIFHYIFIGQDPELIAKVHSKTSKLGGCAKACIDGLRSIMEEEQAKRKLSMMKSIRHSQFSGTFARSTVDGSKTVIKGNPAFAFQHPLHKPFKSQKGVNNMISPEQGKMACSTTNSMLEMLHDFLNQFLSSGYNVLMQSVHEDIEKEHHAIQNCDILVYFKVAEFVTAFQYHKFSCSKPILEADSSEDVDKSVDNTDFKGNICGPIAASMNESMFQLLISRWRNSFDALKETHDYKFLFAAGSLMKNMIHLLDLVLQLLPEDSREPQTARILLYKLFYDQTDQGVTHFILNQIRTFNTQKQSKSHLEDLVEMMYLIVKLMEKLQVRGSLRVSKKLRKMKRKKKAATEKELEHEQRENHEATQSETLGVCKLLETESPVDDFSVRREDICSSIPVDDNAMSGIKLENLPQTESQKHDHFPDDHHSGEDSSSDEQETTVNEVDFKVSSIISAFASCSIIQKLCWLLKFYRSNSLRTNDYIICMLRRITDDLELSPMLYQLSLLRTFHEILADQKRCPNKEYENVVDFIKSLVRRMLKKMKKQPLLFIEILFWKSRKECHYISAEYLLRELSSWRNLSNHHGSVSENGQVPNRRSIADALGDDEADVFIPHELEPRDDENSIKDVSARFPERKGRKVRLDDELTPKIRELYEKFKCEPNCSRLIAESLDPDGKIVAAQVTNRLKQLGLKIQAKRTYASEHHSEPDRKSGGEALDNLNNLEKNLLAKPSNTRKRVRALTEDQEKMIRDLFEQFKDQKKCSSLIANALDVENKLTAAQVSRKLKQLGLVAQRKKSAISADETHDSDNETLLSFRNRIMKDCNSLVTEDAREHSTEEKISDDKTLSTVLMEENGVSRDVAWDAEGTSEAEMRDILPENHSGGSDDNVVDDLDILPEIHSGGSGVNVVDDLDDELADLMDDVSAPVVSTINRRKLRMVLDIEDDD